MRTWIAAACAVLLAGTAAAEEWSYYGRDAGGARFSPLSQITPQNVRRLEVAWTFRTGEVADGRSGVRSGFSATPLLIGGRMYLTTPFNRIVALDPGSGRLLWSYDPKIDRSLPYGDGLVSRGLAAWRDPHTTGACRLRLFSATLDARLVSVDGATGRPCPGFGRNGEVSLSGIRGFLPGVYHMTSPPIVVDGIVVVGSAISDNGAAEAPDGVVRGFDARTGALRWSWRPVERPAEVPGSAWKTGAANAWSIMSADLRRGLVFVPTGSASPDYYGGLRPGDNRWANSVVALEARTGKMVWGFQLVHHDLWDYDTAAPPLLARFRLGGQRRQALFAGNKTGMVFALDPATGHPLLPVEERPAPPSTTEGEHAAPTQPHPASLPPLVRQSLKPEEVFGLSESDRAECRAALAGLRGSSMFTPPDVRGALSIPGVIGGINWSGFAWDARREHLIIPVSNLPYLVRLVPRARFNAGERGGRGSETAPQLRTPYAVIRAPLRAPSGVPCAPPPWGELVALAPATGRVAWRTPLGSMEELVPGIGAHASGSVVLGGPIVTAGGLIFIGGTLDRRFRAFSTETGQELWSAALPASAHATPMTYSWAGRQYVVVAAGGSAKVAEGAQSDALVAFALP